MAYMWGMGEEDRHKLERETLYFKAGSCRMTLNLPEAITDMTLTNIRKFIKTVLVPSKWAWIEYEEMEQNEISMKKFFQYIPIVEEHLKDEWSFQSEVFQDVYQDEKFDKSGNMRTKKDAANIKRVNKHNYSKVAEAKHRYDAFVKRAAALRKLQNEYLGGERA